VASAHATSKRSGVYCVSAVVLQASVIELHTIDLPEAEAPDQKRMLFSAFRIEVEKYEDPLKSLIYTPRGRSPLDKQGPFYDPRSGVAFFHDGRALDDWFGKRA